MRSSCKVSDVLARFWPNLELIDTFSYKSPMSNFTEIRPVGVELIHAGRQTDCWTHATKLMVASREFISCTWTEVEHFLSLLYKHSIKHRYHSNVYQFVPQNAFLSDNLEQVRILNNTTPVWLKVHNYRNFSIKSWVYFILFYWDFFVIYLLTTPVTQQPVQERKEYWQALIPETCMDMTLS
jgi:hypothetical protein